MSRSTRTARSATAARPAASRRFAGQEAIARRAGIEVGSGGRTRNLTRELVQRAEKGDPAVLRSLAETGRYLGIALASAVNLFDVDAVVLGGCFGPLSPWLADDVRRILGERVLSAAWSGCEIRASEFGEGAAVRGAAALTLRSILAEPWLVAERSGLRRERVSAMSYQLRPSRRGGERQLVGAGTIEEGGAARARTARARPGGGGGSERGHRGL